MLHSSLDIVIIEEKELIVMLQLFFLMWRCVMGFSSKNYKKQTQNWEQIK